jgi:predicted amidohydrolase
MRAAAVQLNSTDDFDRNLVAAENLVAEAAGAGATLIVLPEKWSLLGPGELLAARAEPLDSSSAVAAAQGWARQHSAFLLAGSVGERVAGSDRIANTSVLIDPDGAVAATYRKVHMFDVDVGGVAYRESEHEQPGEETVTAPLSDDVELGLTVCYDLRFPELFRVLALAGAGVITVPSAFTATTGEPHWEVLLRARAIENQLFVIGANQVGEAPPHYESWGHSVIVDPWGTVLATVERGEGVAVADLDFAALDDIRQKLPSLANRRPSAYRWPDQTRTETHA